MADSYSMTRMLAEKARKSGGIEMQKAKEEKTKRWRQMTRLRSNLDDVAAYVDAFKRGEIDAGQLRWILDKTGIVNAYRDENGTLHVIPRQENAKFYMLGDDASGYFIKSGGAGGTIVRQEHAKIDKRSVEDHQVKVHESRHAEQHLSGELESYSTDIPWGDRPLELDAERAAIEDYKQRLEASGIKYTPEMGYRYLQMQRPNKSSSPDSQAPLREPIRRNPSGGELSYVGKKMNIDDIEKSAQSEIDMAEKLIKFGGFDKAGTAAKRHRDTYKAILLRLKAARQ